VISNVTAARGSGKLLYDDRKDVAGGQNEVLVAAGLDFGSTVLGVDDDVADGDVNGNAVAVVVKAAGAYCNNFAFLRLLLRGVRNYQAGSRGLLCFERANNNTILKRLNRDRHSDSPFHELIHGLRTRVPERTTVVAVPEDAHGVQILIGNRKGGWSSWGSERPGTLRYGAGVLVMLLNRPGPEEERATLPPVEDEQPWGAIRPATRFDERTKRRWPEARDG
jgi:hypothetical protein